MYEMRPRLKVLILISCFVLLYAAYYWGIPAVLDVQHKIPVIQKFVKNELGTDIEIKDPRLKMGLTPSVWIDASYFSLVDKNSKPLSVVNPKIKIHLLPLLFGKINLVYFSCDEINAKLKIDKDYRLYIGNSLIMKSSNPRVSIEDSQMDIGGYNVNLKDEIQNKDISLKGDYFNLEKYNSKKYIKFSTDSKIKVDNRLSTINADVDFKLPFKKGFNTNEIIFDGTVTNFNLEDLSPYIKKISNNKIKQTKGILNIQADTKILNRRTRRIATQMAIENLSIEGKDKASSVSFKNKLTVTSMIDISKNVLKIKKLKILSGKINANVSGKINKIGSKNPLLNLSILVNKSRMEDFINLMPATNFNNVNVNIIALKKYGYYSDLEGKLSIKGRADKPRLDGEFLSTNGYVIKPLPNNVPKASVKLNFLGEKLYMDILVPISQSEKIMVKGTVPLYDNKPSSIDVSSTSNVDLQTTESILNPIHEIFNFDVGPLPEMKLQGLGNINLKIGGTPSDPTLFGAFNFKNTTASFNGVDMLLKNGEGSLYFKDRDTHLITKNAFLNGKTVKIDGKCSLKGVLDYDVTANGQELEDLLNLLANSPLLENLQKSVPSIKNTSGKINIALKINANVKSIEEFTAGKNVVASGNIKLLGDNILFTSLQMPMKNLFGNIKFKNLDADFDLYSVVDKSKIYIKGKVKNKILSSKIKLDDIAFVYSNIPVKIFSGSLEIINDKLALYKVNAALDSMPVLIDGSITDIFKNPNFNIYANSKPTQKFIEKYINKNATYPLKVKGDIVYSSRVHGTKDSFNTKTEMNLQADSNIYYMGSTLGDANDPIRIYIDANVSRNHSKNSIYVNNFQYDKLISSQNNKEFVSQQLNAKGQININKNDISLQGFRVKTQNPTDAKVFNIIFKKPLIKQGLFTSNVVINNRINSPKLFGTLNFSGVNIPLLDTTIKDISLDFNEKDIDIKSKGEVFSNQVTFFSNMENRLVAPYVLNDLDIYLGNLDINQIIKSFNKLQIDTDMHKLSIEKSDATSPDITNLIIKKAKIKADSVSVKNILAQNLTANFSLDEKLIFSVDNFKFDVAEGNVNGDFKYNLLNAKSGLGIHVNNVNANTMAEALFDLKNQIFGSLTGQAELTCNGKTHKTCMDTLAGTGGFRVVDGRMPKLGSLEYLLKAANLVKSGVTGITINSILELVTPLKTGQFENINGNFSIKSGIADSVQIFSRGKDLSLFLTGTYNFSTLIADMKVFGRISKKISNVLGAVGNTSLNTLFNTIPGLNLEETNKTEFVRNINKIPGFELNDKTYRIFSAEIYGDINGENYVQSFKWVE